MKTASAKSAYSPWTNEAAIFFTGCFRRCFYSPLSIYLTLPGGDSLKSATRGGKVDISPNVDASYSRTSESTGSAHSRRESRALDGIREQLDANEPRRQVGAKSPAAWLPRLPTAEPPPPSRRMCDDSYRAGLEKNIQSCAVFDSVFSAGGARLAF